MASFPGPRCFWLHKENEGPGIFSHMRDIKGIKGDRKDLIEHGCTGAHNSKKS